MSTTQVSASAAASAPHSALNIDPKKVRAAGVAGRFYPADPAELVDLMDDLLAQAPPTQIEGEILGIVAPHAGYQYSGPVAAHAYAALRGRAYKRVVVVAPSHYEAFDFTSVYDGDAYQTPLGILPVDREFAAKLAGRDSTIHLSASGHRPTAHGAEHALEVQLPWLQHILGSFQLVPVVMGNHDYQNCRGLGVALAELIQAEQAGGDTLIVASSDLSHFHPYREAVQLDRKTLNAIESWDYFSMSRNFQSRVWEACGGAPVVAAMIAAERMGARRARVLHYANSGDVGGDRSRVVGYGAGVLVKAKASAQPQAPFSLSDPEKEALLVLARQSVEHAVRTRDVFEPELPQSVALQQERGAFVTLKIDAVLRGCVGFASAVKPLYMTVRDTSTLAALRDPRFQPVEVSELDRLQYDISVLSPLRRAMDIGEIEVGRHGLLVKLGNHEGLLLPQVPVEHRWDAMTFLQQTCMKAGLKPEAWADPGIDIFLFTAVIFGEVPHPAEQAVC
jgi:AmmeMemoRadiSam system protein B/AmmeMemoRadiSam system protein A